MDALYFQLCCLNTYNGCYRNVCVCVCVLSWPLQLKALEFVHRNGPLDGKDSLNSSKKSAAISQRVEENRREESEKGRSNE